MATPDWFRWGFPRPVTAEPVEPTHGRDSDGLLGDCPRCRLPVLESQKPVLWDGRVMYGHRGCLDDELYERDRDDLDGHVSSRAFAENEYHRELGGGA